MLTQQQLNLDLNTIRNNNTDQLQFALGSLSVEHCQALLVALHTNVSVTKIRILAGHKAANQQALQLVFTALAKKNNLKSLEIDNLPHNMLNSLKTVLSAHPQLKSLALTPGATLHGNDLILLLNHLEQHNTQLKKFDLANQALIGHNGRLALLRFGYQHPTLKQLPLSIIEFSNQYNEHCRIAQAKKPRLWFGERMHEQLKQFNKTANADISMLSMLPICVMIFITTLLVKNYPQISNIFACFLLASGAIGSLFSNLFLTFRQEAEYASKDLTVYEPPAPLVAAPTLYAAPVVVAAPGREVPPPPYTAQALQHGLRN